MAQSTASGVVSLLGGTSAHCAASVAPLHQVTWNMELGLAPLSQHQHGSITEGALP